MRAARSVRWISMRCFFPSSPERKVPSWARQPTSTPDARRRISTRRSTTTPSPRSLRPCTRWRSNPDCSPATTGERDCLLSPREIVRHGCAAHAECLALFEKAGDAVRYRIARVLKSPLMRLPNLKPLVRYAVCGPETPADRGELFVRDGLWGFKIGERESIPPIYDAGFDFSEGLAAVRTGRLLAFHRLHRGRSDRLFGLQRGKTVRKRPGDRRPRRTTSGHRPQGTPNHLAYLTANNYLYPKNTCSDRVVSRAIRKINFRLPVALTIFAKDRRRLGQVRTSSDKFGQPTVEAEGTRELCHAKKETKRDVWLAVHLSLSLT